MKPVGRLLGEDAVDDDVRAAPIYLRSFNSIAVELLSSDGANKLLRHVRASPALTVAGDLGQGFAWLIPGSHPRCSHVVRPLAALTWPVSAGTTCALIELWRAADETGARYRVSSYNRRFDDPFTAYLTACCLWARPDTGQGTVTVLLYGRDGFPYAVEAKATTCSGLPVSLVDELATNYSERFTTAEPSKAPALAY